MEYLHEWACGSCRLTEELYSYYFDTIDVVDISKKMIDGAKLA